VLKNEAMPARSVREQVKKIPIRCCGELDSFEAQRLQDSVVAMLPEPITSVIHVALKHTPQSDWLYLRDVTKRPLV
jgi:hypothetical protein